MVAAGKSIQLVFVSSDRDEAQFKEYFQEMPWLALPYSNRQVKSALSSNYGVRGIPALILLDGQTGALITKNGRALISKDPDGAEFPWASVAAQEEETATGAGCLLC